MRRLQLFLLAVVVVTIVALPQAARLTHCPEGTRPEGIACVLEADLVITEPIELASDTTLNCRGYRILPFAAGIGTPPTTYVPSVPESAIVITGGRGVNLRNCRLGEDAVRFDFGIVALQAKRAGADGHRIQGNEIHVRSTGILLLDTDDTRLSDNVITWTEGFGIALRRNSDGNRVINNVLSSPGRPAAPARIVPGGRFIPQADDGIAIAPFPDHVLYNIVIGSELFQFPNSTDGIYDVTDDNVVEGNHLSMPGSSAAKSHAAIIVGANLRRSTVAGNTIVQAGAGIRLAGLMPELTIQRAAQCIRDDGALTSRFCETSADCFIAGIDAAPLGICPVLAQDIIDGRARNTVVEGNSLIGPFNSTAAQFRAGVSGGAGTVAGIIRGNWIHGTGSEAGISLAGNMIETGVVTGNRIHNASVGLLLSEMTARRFSAHVSLNDITGSAARAIGVLGIYALPTELSWDGFGNFWGHTVPPCSLSRTVRSPLSFSTAMRSVVPSRRRLTAVTELDRARGWCFSVHIVRARPSRLRRVAS